MLLMKVGKFWNVAAIALIAALVLTLGVAPNPAAAGRSGCRADPVITLTNGTQIQIVTGIATDISDVQSIVYTVHAPAGSRVLSVVYTYSLLGVR